MAKGRHQKDKLWLIHTELTSSAKNGKSSKLESADFQHCALSLQSFEPGSEVVSDSKGRLYLKDVAENWAESYTCNPFDGEPLKERWWFPVNFSWSEDGLMICPLTNKTLTSILKIVLNKNNGFVYSQNGLDNLTSSRQKLTADPMDCSKLNPKTDLICIHDPDDPKVNKRGDRELTKDFLEKHKRVKKEGEDAPSSRTVIRGSALTKRIIKQIEEEGGTYESAAKKLKPADGAGEESGYVDPVTGEKKLVKSRVHTSGDARAALTCTAQTSELSKAFRYLTSREYRTLIYKRMQCRRHVNSEVAVTLALHDSLRGKKYNLNSTYFAWKFPETVHQIIINILLNKIKLFRVADEYNDETGVSECLWHTYEPAFSDVDDEIETIEKHIRQEPFIEAGSIFRRLDQPTAIGITAHGFPREHVGDDGSVGDDGGLHVLGKVADPKMIQEIILAHTRELITRDTVVHSNPYIECEKLAIEEYSSR